MSTEVLLRKYQKLGVSRKFLPISLVVLPISILGAVWDLALKRFGAKAMLCRRTLSLPEIFSAQKLIWPLANVFPEHSSRWPDMQTSETFCDIFCKDWEFPNLVVSNLLVYILCAEALFCALLHHFTFLGALAFALFLRSFALSCVFLQPTAFRTTVFGNIRKDS